MPAAGHQLEHGQSARRDRSLRQHRHPAGDVAPAQLVQRDAVEQHLSRPCGEQAGEPAQQSGLPAAVRADHGRDAAGGDLQIEAVDDGAAVVCEGEADGLEPDAGHAAVLRRVLMMSQIR